MSTVGDPGTHGAAVTGTQGWGVSTPLLAAVAEATAGLDVVVHIPKGKIFTLGLKSIMVAAGRLPVSTVNCELAINVDGAAPKEHIVIALIHTQVPMVLPP